MQPPSAHSQDGGEPRPNPASSRGWSGWIAVVAIVVRIVYFLQYARSPLMGDAQADQLYYLEWAREIAAGDWWGSQPFEQGPLYPYLVGLLFRLIGEEFVVVFFLQMLAGVALCLLIAATGRRMFGERVGVIAGFAAAVYGPFVFYECMILKSSLSPLLTMLALYSAERYFEGHRRRWLVGAGASIALAGLVRENHLLLAIPIVVAIPIARGERSWRAQSIDVGVLVASIVAGLAPVSIRNTVVSGELVVVTTGGGEVLYMGHGPWASAYYGTPDFVPAHVGIEHAAFRSEAARRLGRPVSRSESSRFWAREAWNSIRRDPLRSLRLTAWKGLVLFEDFEVPDSEDYDATREFVPILRVLPTFGWFGGLALVGVLFAAVDWRRSLLPLGFFGAHVVSVLLTYNFGRFRLGMIPLVLLFAALASVSIVRLLRSGGRGDRMRGGIALTIALATSAAMLTARPPEGFAITKSSNVARLAILGEDDALAERELRRILELAGRSPDSTGHVQRAAVIAQTHSMLGAVLLRSGRITDGLLEIRAASGVTLPTELARGMELEMVGNMIRTLQSWRSTGRTRSEAGSTAAIRREVAARGERLCELDPDSPAHWTLAALAAESASQREAISIGLEAAWSGVTQKSTEQRDWHLAGQALLADLDGRTIDAKSLANDVLRSNPSHPLNWALDDCGSSRTDTSAP